MSVTDGDRERANELMRIPLNAQDWTQCRDLVAQALADERERARAPFLRLADELWGMGQRIGTATAGDLIKRAATGGYQ